MQSITTLSDLERYGIEPLTGEACGLMYRVLFDLTATGKRIIEACLSVQSIQLEEPWNFGKPDNHHVGSIMLSPEFLPAIGLFALLDAGCSEVWRKGDSLFGIESSDSADWLEDFKNQHGPLRRFVCKGTAGDRNFHQMTGRVR